PPQQPPPSSLPRLPLPLPPQGAGTDTAPSPRLEDPGPTAVFDTANLQDKLHGYLLDPDHEQNQGKAIWFQKALGFDKNNWQQLASQLYFDESTAVFQKITPHGRFYQQEIPITGPNGRTINEVFVFKKDRGGNVTFVTRL